MSASSIAPAPSSPSNADRVPAYAVPGPGIGIPCRTCAAAADSRLGDRLVAAGLVSRAEIEEAATLARRTDRRLGEVLIADGIVQDRDVYRHLAHQRGLTFSTGLELLEQADPAVVSSISRPFQEYHHLMPIARHGKRLVVATCEPNGDFPELAAAADVEALEFIVVTPSDYRRLRSAFDLETAGQHAVVTMGLAGADLLSAQAGVDEPLKDLFDAILLDAVSERASDIHLEVYEGRVRVRLRVDGELRDLPHYHLGTAQLLGLINVSKVRAKMDLAEHRVPQGGRFTVHAGERRFDVRAQTQPALHGEHLVLRLLPQDRQLLSIGELGFPPPLARSYRRLLDNPGGLLLVVGPTGSGKSTTLYAGLQVLAADPTRKVITVEDPIEYSIEGVQQCQVRPELGFSFASAMRAFVREDPDVILVGEIRDGETALEALRASQTGHLVLSTLHCNDAVDTVQRLLDLGMHPNSIASELSVVIAQRLAKRICDGCRRPHMPDAEHLAEIFPNGVPADFHAFHGAGCERCEGTGTYGRIAVVEYLQMNREMREAITHQCSLDELRQAALRAGLAPMRDQALVLVGEGVIAIEELSQMLTSERLAPER